MIFNLWGKPEFERIPAPVHKYMGERFMLRADYLESLRCFEHEGKMRGETVRLISIFSPVMARELGLTVKCFSDLESYPEARLFEGYIAGNGQVYVADRRPPPVKEAVLVRYQGSGKLRSEIRTREEAGQV